MAIRYFRYEQVKNQIDKNYWTLIKKKVGGREALFKTHISSNTKEFWSTKPKNKKKKGKSYKQEITEGV